MRFTETKIEGHEFVVPTKKFEVKTSTELIADAIDAMPPKKSSRKVTTKETSNGLVVSVSEADAHAAYEPGLTLLAALQSACLKLGCWMKS